MNTTNWNFTQALLMHVSNTLKEADELLKSSNSSQPEYYELAFKNYNLAYTSLREKVKELDESQNDEKLKLDDKIMELNKLISHTINEVYKAWNSRAPSKSKASMVSQRNQQLSEYVYLYRQLILKSFYKINVLYPKIESSGPNDEEMYV